MLPPTRASCELAAGVWLRARVPRKPEMVTAPRVSRVRLTLHSLSIRLNSGESVSVRGPRGHATASASSGDDVRSVPQVGRDGVDRGAEYEDLASEAGANNGASQ